MTRSRLLSQSSWWPRILRMTLPDLLNSCAATTSVPHPSASVIKNINSSFRILRCTKGCFFVTRRGNVIVGILQQKKVKDGKKFSVKRKKSTKHVFNCLEQEKKVGLEGQGSTAPSIGFRKHFVWPFKSFSFKSQYFYSFVPHNFNNKINVIVIVEV